MCDTINTLTQQIFSSAMSYPGQMIKYLKNCFLHYNIQNQELKCFKYFLDHFNINALSTENWKSDAKKINKN